jgi:uncharacterized membrane protein YdbT with pleckstrin-like domain
VDLLEGERIIYRGHPSWRSQIGWYVKWGLLALLPAAIAGALRAADADTGLPYWQWILLSCVLFLLVLIMDAIRRLAVTYTITERRVHIRRGILSRREQSTHIERVQNVNVSQSALERVLGVGSVDFDTAGTGELEDDFRFIGVARPRELVLRVEAESRRADDWTVPGRA